MSVELEKKEVARYNKFEINSYRVKMQINKK